jgi:hypothetical protein
VFCAFCASRRESRDIVRPLFELKHANIEINVLMPLIENRKSITKIRKYKQGKTKER